MSQKAQLYGKHPKLICIVVCDISNVRADLGSSYPHGTTTFLILCKGRLSDMKCTVMIWRS